MGLESPNLMEEHLLNPPLMVQRTRLRTESLMLPVAPLRAGEEQEETLKLPREEPTFPLKLSEVC